MPGLLLAVGLGLALIGWQLPRRVAGARLHLRSLLLDLALPLSAFAMLAALTARPIFAGGMSLLLGAGYAFAERCKRRVLAEPIVFTDVFQAVDIFRHPQLALPFPKPGRVLLGGGAAMMVLVAWFWTEPAAWSWAPWHAGVVAGFLLALVLLLAGPFNSAAAGILQRLGLSGDPMADAAAIGPLALLIAYGILARAQRDTRRGALAVPARRRQSAFNHRAIPVVVVQGESFFDARRLHRALDENLLPAFDRLCGSGLQWGRLAVPCWGANTVRTEFAVLTGLTQQAVGFDRFNPYHRFARAPVPSLAWRMRAMGYRTICLHPFDRRFYGRDKVMAHLGFDDFLAQESFAGAPLINGFVTDVEVARVAQEILRDHPRRIFLFIITMENHGPWPAAASTGAHCAPALDLPACESNAFAHYLNSLRNTDRMIGHLAGTLQDNRDGGVLGFYGDHLPSFNATFSQFDFCDRSSDYLVWRAGGGCARRQDLCAEELGNVILSGCAKRHTVTAQRRRARKSYVGVHQTKTTDAEPVF